MKVVLLGLEFYIGNRGCEALTYSFLEELNQAAAETGLKIDVEALVMAWGEGRIFSENLRSVTIVRIEPKKASFWKRCRSMFAGSDLIVDFSMGDSFSDMYGTKRFFIFTAVKELAVRSGTPFVLGPQTYGPFCRRWVQRWAAGIIKRSRQVYARDDLSREYVYELCGRECVQTTDVAFSLPYRPAASSGKEDGRIRVGINVSGLLWQGGYTTDNQFGLKVDYQEYCRKIIQNLLEEKKYRISLIPHVGNRSDQRGENDFSASMELKKLFRELEIADRLESAVEIKSEIAKTDIFIGARMHATIAAFSAGVATIPFSYSRKFEGLYRSIGYDYVIEALRITTEEAIETTMDYIRQYEKLRERVAWSMEIVKEKQKLFRQELVGLLTEISDETGNETGKNL